MTDNVFVLMQKLNALKIIALKTVLKTTHPSVPQTVRHFPIDVTLNVMALLPSTTLMAVVIQPVIASNALKLKGLVETPVHSFI